VGLRDERTAIEAEAAKLDIRLTYVFMSTSARFDRPAPPALLARLDRLNRHLKGYLVTVRVEARMSEFLRWDVRVSEQSFAVRHAITMAAKTSHVARRALLLNSHGRVIYEELAASIAAEVSEGCSSPSQAKRAASGLLAGYGIAGVMHPASSVENDTQARLVVFDPKRVTLLHRSEAHCLSCAA
jgi:hypothetical protein